MHKIKSSTIIFYCMLMVIQNAFGNDSTKTRNIIRGDDAGLVLPTGFGSEKVVTDLGRAWHIAITANGDVFVKLEKLKNGKGIYRLHDSDGDGKQGQILTGHSIAHVD